MNTFTFTDEEVEWLIKLIDLAKGIEDGSPFLAIKEKLERKPKYIIGESDTVYEGKLYKNAGALLVMDKEGEPEQISGGLMTIQMPKFTHDGDIIFNPKEK